MAISGKCSLKEYCVELRDANWMSFAFLFRCLMLNMFRMLILPSSGALTYLLSYFMGCIALVRCVLVLRCGLAGVVSYPDAG